jgi:hypothetical protein
MRRALLQSMTIRPSLDIATRVSAGLSALLENTAADPDREAPPSLGEVRALLRRRRATARQTEFLHPSDADSLLAELDALIDEFGPEAGAASFVVSQASEGLSRVIETVVNDPATPKRPSLALLRESMTQGLLARLAGNGTIDEEDDTALFAEVEELIRRYGEAAPAEGFLRYE